MAIITGMSKTSADLATLMPAGATTEASPSTLRMLKILLPTTFPTAMSRSPRKAATTEVATSGSEVPAATIVSPMISSETPKCLAICTAPSTRNFEPITRPPTPTRIRPTLTAQWLGFSFAPPNSWAYSNFTASLVSLRLWRIRNHV